MRALLSVGTRPEIVKMAPLIRVLNSECELIFIHSGQHSDLEMSGNFIRELGLPEPDNLEIERGTQAEQTAQALVRFEAKISESKPDLVLVQGDTNTTLACALAAVKLKVPVAHVEAGLRSFDRTMPEEINRVLTDHCSELLFAPHQEAKKNLLKEGVPEKKIHVVGNTIADVVGQSLKIALKQSKVLELEEVPKEFILVTAHRPSNVDDVENLRKLVDILLAVELPVVFPAHPRTEAKLHTFGMYEKLKGTNVKVIESQPYFDFLTLLKHCRLVLTDSGGIQEEAAILNVPCVTLRYNTERPETVKAGKNVVVGLEKDLALKQIRKILKDKNARAKMTKKKALYGSRVSEKIKKVILDAAKNGKLNIEASTLIKKS